MLAAVPSPQHADSVTLVKLTLMRGLDRKIRGLYPSQLDAERQLDVAQQRLSLLRTMKTGEFSLPWLLMLADKIGAHVTVAID